MTSIANAALFEGLAHQTERVKQQNIFRAKHDRENPYTLITNKLLRDTTIKHSDRGLMCQLLSWSDHHNLCIQAVVKKSVEGRDAIRGMIDRLITAGYIRMIQNKDSNGQFDKVNYQIFEQSTGAVVADLDLSGIVNNEELEESPQLDLFCMDSEEDEAVNNDTNNQNDEVTGNGFSVSGKAETNNNYDSSNTKNNSNKGLPEKTGNQGKTAKQEKSLSELLNTWHLSFEDPLLKARIGMAGLSAHLINQEQLDRFLIDFNQQHEKYQHLNHTQRLKNFVAYLVRVFNTRVEYAKHVARMNALGYRLAMPTNAKKQNQVNERIQAAQTGCNPFEVKQTIPVEVSAAFQAAIEGF